MYKAFVFPGQGCQSVGMARDFYKKYKSVNMLFSAANDILGIDLVKLSFFGPSEELTRTENAQPAILMVSLAIHTVLQENGIYPDVLVGQSLGEFSACVAAGSITFEQGLKIVRQRGFLMSEASKESSGGMVAIVGLSVNEVEKLVAEASELGIVAISSYNTPQQIVVSGVLPAINRVHELSLKAKAYKSVILHVNQAFHSPIMAEVQEEFGKYMAGIKFTKPNYPIASCSDGELMVSAEDIKRKLILQCTAPVKWVYAVNSLVEYGVSIFVEVGPGKVLYGLNRNIKPDLPTYPTMDIACLLKAVKIVKKKTREKRD